MTRRRYLPDGDYVVVSDLQCPDHDVKVVKAVQRFIRVRIRKGKVFPEVVMIHDGAFCVNGIVYRV